MTYEVLPAVFDERDAMIDGAPVHPRRGRHRPRSSTGTATSSTRSRPSGATSTPALAEAAHVFEQTFRVHQVQQCPIEPHISIAWLDADERMVIRTATQVPFHTRRMVAPLLDMDIKDVRVIKPRIGGGSGPSRRC